MWTGILAVAFVATACHNAGPEIDEASPSAGQTVSGSALAAATENAAVPENASDDAALAAVLVKTSGPSVQYAVKLNAAGATVAAFGADILFDPAVLTFSGWERGDLTQSFTQIDLVPQEPGRLRMGGFTIEQAIGADQSGALATISFETTSEAPASLRLSNLVDDIAGLASGSE